MLAKKERKKTISVYDAVYFYTQILNKRLHSEISILGEMLNKSEIMEISNNKQIADSLTKILR